MQAARDLGTHIDTSQSRAVIAGTDIKVSHVASLYEHVGMTPDEIVQAHPHVTLADVHAALAYFYDHPDEIRADWEESEALVRALRGRYPSRVAQKLGS